MRSRFQRFIRILLPPAFAFLLFVPTADAQYFGRNKVQWEKFDFKVMKTEHFDIYYYGDKYPAVEDAARMAERWYDRLSKVFDHQLTGRKPIVLYANHADFQQTTTTGGLIGQGTGGFTDAFKNRVVMPLTGSYAETDHVLGHELVHVFQFDSGTRGGGQRSGGMLSMPLWMVEGLAEYLTQGRVDPLTSMWLRDASMHERLPDLPRLTRDPRFSPYHYGQAFWAYVGGRWGDAKVLELFRVAQVVGPDQAIQRVLEVRVPDLFAAWHASVRTAYQTPIATRRPPIAGASLLIGDKRPGQGLNIAPAISPDGRRMAFLSSRGLFSIDLFVSDLGTGHVKQLVSTATNAHFDALRFIDSAGDWSPDGRQLVFVVFDRGDNRLGFVDAETGQIVNQRTVPGVSAIANPVWAPDGRTIAFSGSTNGVTDLYTIDITSGELRRLTNDAYMELQPDFSPDGRSLAFVTDRGEGTDLQTLEWSRPRLAVYDLATGNITTFTPFPGAKHINPQYSGDGRSVFFVADPEGIPDVFRYDFEGGHSERITRVASGVSGITDMSPAISYVPATNRLTYSALENSEWNIYSLDLGTREQMPLLISGDAGAAPAGVLPGATAQTADSVTRYLEQPSEGLLSASSDFPVSNYRPRLTVDYIGPPTIGVGADRYGYGFGGSLSVYWGDILGQHQVGLMLQGDNTSIGGSSTSNLAGQVFYLNRQQRVNWGASLTHLPYVSGFTNAFRDFVEVDGETYLADIYQQYRETITVDEAAALTQYPLSLTRRFEGSLAFSHQGFETEIEQVIVVGNTVIDREIIDLGAPPSMNLYRAATAFVGDSSFFGFVSPIRGTRYRYEIEQVSGDLQFQTALADYRRYFFFNPLTLAVRGLHYGRYGGDSEDERLSQLYVGRASLVRGYDDISVRECTNVSEENSCPEFNRLVGSKVAVANLELRVPLFGTRDYGLFELPYLPTELVAFADGGVAWTEDETPELRFKARTTERVPVFSAGIAARILLGGYIPLEFYWAKPFQRPDVGTQFGFNIIAGW
jgi:Tol biopolymer transport system component